MQMEESFQRDPFLIYKRIKKKVEQHLQKSRVLI